MGQIIGNFFKLKEGLKDFLGKLYEDEVPTTIWKDVTSEDNLGIFGKIAPFAKEPNTEFKSPVPGTPHLTDLRTLWCQWQNVVHTQDEVPKGIIPSTRLPAKILSERDFNEMEAQRDAERYRTQNHAANRMINSQLGNSNQYKDPSRQYNRGPHPYSRDDDRHHQGDRREYHSRSNLDPRDRHGHRDRQDGQHRPSDRGRETRDPRLDRRDPRDPRDYDNRRGDHQQQNSGQQNSRYPAPYSHQNAMQQQKSHPYSNAHQQSSAIPMPSMPYSNALPQLNYSQNNQYQSMPQQQQQQMGYPQPFASYTPMQQSQAYVNPMHPMMGQYMAQQPVYGNAPQYQQQQYQPQQYVNSAAVNLQQVPQAMPPMNMANPNVYAQLEEILKQAKRTG